VTQAGENLVRALWQAFDEGRFDDVRPLLADDFVAEWPQTNERIVGRDNFIALNTTYPGRWRCTLQDVLGDGDRMVTQVEISDGDHSLYATSFFTIESGRIRHAREFFGDVMEPPYDRTAWTKSLS
jgi:hypothetical protein